MIIGLQNEFLQPGSRQAAGPAEAAGSSDGGGRDVRFRERGCVAIDRHGTRQRLATQLRAVGQRQIVGVALPRAYARGSCWWAVPGALARGPCSSRVPGDDEGRSLAAAE